jgi:hypothetical protein
MWRRAGQHAVPVALVAAMMLAAPAAAQPPTPDTPLAGSSFQGGDGNQDDAAPLIDWQFLQAADRVTHNPDPNDEDSVFAGGNAGKETEPGNWDLTTRQGSPNTSNVLDAWSAVDQPGADTFLYLGFARAASNGTTYMAFELNHDPRLWNNGRANIPCRRDGDLQVSFEQQGNEVGLVIRRWTTGETHERSGCDTTGDLDRVFETTTNAQGAFNAGSITSRLPGTSPPGTTVQNGLFGEAAVNLTKLLQQAFGRKCMAFNSIWLHTRQSLSITSNMDDYVAPQRLPVWTCTASGVKFFDRNANGVRDLDDPGIPRFLIWADYDNDGVHDRGEPYSVSDRRGRYVIHDIRPPRGRYWLRERLLQRRSRTLPVASDWQCSFPTDTATNGRFPCAWGPIDVNANPNVADRDFGNWFPARLIVEKRLFPSTDPGRFDLLINDEVVVAAAGDRETGARSVPPGTYTVSERAVTGTDPNAYRTRLWCRGARLLGSPRAGSSAQVTLTAGQAVRCTFYNVRPGSPAIAIAKSGPEVATAGDTLRYRLVVTNPGDVPFAASAVRVTDERCDDPPELVSKSDDPTPDTLDPDDEWIYRCSQSTPRPGDDCDPTRVPNEAIVTGTRLGVTVSDDDNISTILLCPDNPVPPIPPTPGPDPGPVVPPGPTPPDAGAAGTAGLIFERAIQGCIGRRVPRVDLSGVRISTVRVYVNGHLRRGLTVRTLQSETRPRVKVAPGRRYRLRVRVTFQRGTDSPPVTLTSSFRTCARPPAACPSAATERRARVACAALPVRRWRRPT